jgi:hypothetical protein
LEIVLELGASLKEVKRAMISNMAKKAFSIRYAVKLEDTLLLSVAFRHVVGLIFPLKPVPTQTKEEDKSSRRTFSKKCFEVQSLIGPPVPEQV